jgi:hypothetical protein
MNLEKRSFVSAKSPDSHRHRGPPVKPPRVGHPVRSRFIGKCYGRPNLFFHHQRPRLPHSGSRPCAWLFYVLTVTEAAPLVALFDEWVPATSTLLRRALDHASLGRSSRPRSRLRLTVPTRRKTATSGAAFPRTCGPAPSDSPLVFNPHSGSRPRAWLFYVLTVTEAAPLVGVFDEWAPATSTLLRRALNHASLGRSSRVTSRLRLAAPTRRKPRRVGQPLLGWVGQPPFNSTFGMFGFTIAPEPKATVTVTVTNCVTDSNGKKTCDTQ